MKRFPRNVAIKELPDGRFRLVPLRRRAEKWAFGCTASAIGTIGLPLFLVSLFLAPLTVYGWLGVAAYFGWLWWELREPEIWELEPNRLTVARSQRRSQRDVSFTRARCSISATSQNTWGLYIFGEEGQDWIQSESLPEIVGVAASVQAVTGWPVSLPALHSDQMYDLLWLALRERDEARVRFLMQYDQVIPALVRLHRDWSRKYRETPLDSLIDLTGAISQGLVSSEWTARAGAVQLLGMRREPDALPRIREMLGDPSAQVRRRAIAECVSFQNAEAVPKLCELLGARDEVSIEVCAALGEIGDRTAVASLSAVLQSGAHASEELRVAAATALGSLRDRTALEVLCQAVGDSSLHVRSAAVTALGDLGDHAAVESLTMALHGHPSVAPEAAIALGKIGHPSAVPMLRRTVGAKDPALATAAIHALGNIRTDEALEIILDVLRSGSPRLRQEAVYTVCAIAQSTDEPLVQLRAALPTLERMAASWLPDSVQRACRRAVAAIKQQTDGVKDLPLASSAHELEASMLPRAAASIKESQRGESEAILRRDGAAH